MHRAVLDIVRFLSVCLSVCHIRVCIETAEYIELFFRGLVAPSVKFLSLSGVTQFQANLPQRGR